MRNVRVFGAVVAFVTVVSLGCQPEEETFVPSRGGSGSGGAKSSAGTTGQRPLIGGTITLLRGGAIAVVSQPDRDVISVIDVAAGRSLGHLNVEPGSVPARGVADGDDRAHVLLRGTGAIATVSVKPVGLVSVRPVCSAPRGITNVSGTLHVACESGELVTIPATGGQSIRRLGVDLRDVVGSPRGLTLTAFRSAQLLELPTLDASPTVISVPPAPLGTAAFTAGVAWRALQHDRRTVLVHQLAIDGDISAMNTSPVSAVPYYRNPCGSAIVRTAVTVFDDGSLVGTREVPGVLPMDAALSPDGTRLFIAATGNSELVEVSLSGFIPAPVTVCGPLSRPPPIADPSLPQPELEFPVGVAMTSDGDLLVHAGNTLQIRGRAGARPMQTVVLGPRVSTTAGQRLFHAASSSISCASCHPEGHDDGHVWTLLERPRRTQPLSGGLKGTAPYHWDGDLRNLDEVMASTFVVRMGGALPSRADVKSLEALLDAIPAPPPPSPDTPVDMAIGRAIFEKANCQSCHAGAALTNRLTMNVGTGGAFQTPSLLGLGRRGPWMHDGCAKRLEDRFDPLCGGTNHGNVSTLTENERRLLVGYLGQL